MIQTPVSHLFFKLSRWSFYIVIHCFGLFWHLWGGVVHVSLFFRKKKITCFKKGNIPVKTLHV